MLSEKSILITGIGTDVGKSMVSLALCKALKRPYWKPIQCGVDEADTDLMLAHNIHAQPEAYRLQAPLSPHHAAQIESVRIDANSIIPPNDTHYIIEGAGGLMVPFTNEGYTFADWALEHDLPIILVVRHYLGSINHTLLSLELIKSKNIKMEGIIISGDNYPEAENIFIHKGYKILGTLPETADINHTTINWYD